MSPRQSPKSFAGSDDSPSAGEAACICSYCAERIEAPREEDWEFEVNADEGEPIRLWTNSGEPPCKEARFHPRCFEACLELGLVDLPKDKEGKP